MCEVLRENVKQSTTQIPLNESIGDETPTSGLNHNNRVLDSGIDLMASKELPKGILRYYCCNILVVFYFSFIFF